MRRDEPEWRAFERLVARIERDASPLGLTVVSPDRIRCRITGRLREVDASIRDRAGALTTTIECRKRRGRQDVIWIEQLVTKRDLLGAQRTIAVSASGFSEAARAIAQAHGIVLKEMHDLSVADLNPATGLDVVFFSHPRASIVSVMLRYAKPTPWSPPTANEIDLVLPPDTDPFAPIFRNVNEGHSWSINDVWHQLQEVANPFADIVKGRAPEIKTVCFPYSGNVAVETPAGQQTLGDLLLTVAIWIQVEAVWKEDAVKVEYSSVSETRDWFISLQLPKGTDAVADLKIGGNWPNRKHYLCGSVMLRPTNGRWGRGAFLTERPLWEPSGRARGSIRHSVHFRGE